MLLSQGIEMRHYSTGRWIITPLLMLWAFIAWLWAAPATPMSPNTRLLLRIAAIVVAVVSLSAGVFFSYVTFSESDPWGRMMNAHFTLGLFGLPTSAVALVIAAIVAKASASQTLANSAAALLMAITFFAQWLLLAAALLRRSLYVLP
jgi:hypothetical protein